MMGENDIVITQSERGSVVEGRWVGESASGCPGEAYNHKVEFGNNPQFNFVCDVDQTISVSQQHKTKTRKMKIRIKSDCLEDNC